MSVPEVINMGDVGVIAYGGTKARSVVNRADGTLGPLTIEETPSDNQAEFVDWLARKVLGMYTDDGVSDFYVGFPGPVRSNGLDKVVGPMVNIGFLERSTMILERELRGYDDPLLRRKLDNGDIAIEEGNDGPLHAAAAGFFLGQRPTIQYPRYFDAVAGLIVGTGVGGAVVDRAEGHYYRRTNEDVLRPIYSPRKGLHEWGHMNAGNKDKFTDTYEARYSGPAFLNSNYDFGLSALEASEIPDAPIWGYAGRGIGDIIADIALTEEPDLLVISGGFGSREYKNYGSALRRRMADMIASGNVNLAMALETLTIKPSNPDIADSYEIYGAPSLLAAHRIAA